MSVCWCWCATCALPLHPRVCGRQVPRLQQERCDHLQQHDVISGVLRPHLSRWFVDLCSSRWCPSRTLSPAKPSEHHHSPSLSPSTAACVILSSTTPIALHVVSWSQVISTALGTIPCGRTLVSRSSASGCGVVQGRSTKCGVMQGRSTKCGVMHVDASSLRLVLTPIFASREQASPSR